MVALFLLSLLLATAALASPMRRDYTTYGASNVPASAATLPQSFTPMPSSPNMVLLGVGSQNYTCNSNGTYDYVGAYAQMYDISGCYGTEQFYNISNDVYNYWNSSYDYDSSVYAQELISLNVTIYGTFYSIQQNGVLIPVWNLTSIGSYANNLNAIIYGQENNSVPSSNSTYNTNWVEYNTSGGWANIIYSVDTVGGQPPSSCTPGSYETFKYAATYWCV
ncbi:hypothetical protein V8E52_003016 [Russula decolorans]